MKLIKRGINVNFMDYEVKIYKENNEVITTGKRLNNQFIVCMNPTIKNINNECNSVNVSVNNVSDDTVNSDKFSERITQIWHRRLGHVNDKCMQRLMKEKLVTGINNKLGNIYCEAYKTCKLIRKPYKSIIYSQSNRVLDLIHLDICGLMPVVYKSSRYILLIVDDYTGMYFTYFLKNKSDTFYMFQIFSKKYKNILGKGIKRIGTNNGTESY